eukprot:gb/GFBE01042968.1/.p1 GENE.gb/GFBE01042968.1/~~gb/GFBE01042968.1/.p1  ORF type:complete len:479 (+),score=139.67 gb/GFBE01042968.1/:1-1437(+)
MQLISAIAQTSLVLVLAAAVATKKSASETGAALVEAGPSPWLALLTSSWTLAGKPDQEKSQGLEALADQIVHLAKSGSLQNPDAGMQEAVEDIQAIVVDMKEAINASNDAAQQSMDDKRAALDKCTAPATMDLGVFTAGLDPSADDVVTCREEERGFKVNYTDCETEKERCSNTTACCHPLLQPNAYCLPVGGASPQPSVLESQCNGRSKCKLDDLNAMLTYFQGKMTELNAADQACTDSRAGCVDGADCTPLKNEWDTKNDACDAIQIGFEQAFCTHAQTTEASWANYSSCYDSADANLKAEETKQRNILPGRQQEWRGVLRIECLLSALSQSTVEAQTAKLEQCIDTTYGESHWAHLQLTYPSEAADYPTKATCSEVLKAPGSEHFKNTYYSEVLDMIPEELSTYHCVAVTEYCEKSSAVSTGALLLTKSALVAKSARPHTRVWAIREKIRHSKPVHDAPPANGEHGAAKRIRIKA